MRASPPQTSVGPPLPDHAERAPRRWLWVVAATCLVALGTGAVIGYSFTRDTHVGRGTIGNAVAPEPGPSDLVGASAAPTPDDVTAPASAPDVEESVPADEKTAGQTLA